MPVPSFDIENYVENHIPPSHRTSWFKGWLKGISSALDRLQKLFNSFLNGSIDSGYWDSTSTYNFGDRVRTKGGKVYESIAFDETTGLGIPNLNHDVSDSNWWFEVLDYYIGVNEYSQYTSQKLVFEYALNRRFEKYLIDAGFVGFKNPTTINPGIGYLPLSDIYLENQAATFSSFISYPDGRRSSASYPDHSDDFVFPVPSYVLSTRYTGIINIPNAVYLSLGATNEIRDSIIMDFVNKIRKAGTIYTINQY